MKKVILALLLLAMVGPAHAVRVYLVAHNQRSMSGTLSTLIWDGSNSTNPWALNPNATGENPNNPGPVTASTVVWDWDPINQILTGTGRYEATSHLQSNPASAAVIDDKVVNLVINTALDTTTADSYDCIEGNFLQGVQQNGCLNTSFGGNATNNSYADYNVGGGANCVNRHLNANYPGATPNGGDDSANTSGGPRGLFSAAAVGGCDFVGGFENGAFGLWDLVYDDGPASNGTFRIRNSIPETNPNTNYMTFTYAPVPAAVWLFGSALGLLGWVRRRAAN